MKDGYINLELESANGIFFAGHVIQGTLMINKSILAHVKKVGVTMVGETQTHWTEKGRDYMLYETHFNQFIDLTLNLSKILDDKSDPKEFSLLKFSFPLPAAAPSSFESNFGYTRYSCDGKVELIGHSHHIFDCEATGYSCERKFFVLAAIPSGYYTGFDAAVSKEDTIEIVGCLGYKENVNVSLALPTAEVALGSSIIGSLKVNNQTKRPLKSLSIALAQHILLEAKAKSNELDGNRSSKRVIECIIAFRNLMIVKPGKTRKFEFQLLIPDVVPPTQIGRIVRIQYRLSISIDKHCGHELSVPIVVTLSQ